jgi:hypothetical protein
MLRVGTVLQPLRGNLTLDTGSSPSALRPLPVPAIWQFVLYIRRASFPCND